MYFFLFNRTALQIFVTYITGALYMRPLWFYKHQHDNRVRSKLFAACQRWWFQWRFWFVPSVPGYLREEEEHKLDPWRTPIKRNHMGLHLEKDVAVVKPRKSLGITLYIHRVQLTKCNVSQFIYFCKTLCMFQAGLPSIITSSKLHIQRQVFVRPILLPAASLTG